MYEDEGDDDLLIISDPTYLDGKPIIKGTRITVEGILRELARGMSVEQILNEHPRLTRKEIKAALVFASESVRFDHSIQTDAHAQE